MIRTIAAAAGLAVAASGASAAFVGGGEYSFGATLSDGTNVLVNRLFLAFDGNGGANSMQDGAVNVFNANFSTNNGEQILEVADPGSGGANNLPVSDGAIGFDADFAFDTFASIGNLRQASTTTIDPNGFNITATSLTGDAGWFTGNPPENEHLGRAPGSSDATPAGLTGGFLYQFIGQFTTIVDGGVAEGGPSFTGVGDGFIASNNFNGILSLTDVGTGQAFLDVAIQRIPTPGALALFGIAGLTAVRRRRG